MAAPAVPPSGFLPPAPVSGGQTAQPAVQSGGEKPHQGSVSPAISVIKQVPPPPVPRPLPREGDKKPGKVQISPAIAELLKSPPKPMGEEPKPTKPKREKEPETRKVEAESPTPDQAPEEVLIGVPDAPALGADWQSMPAVGPSAGKEAEDPREATASAKPKPAIPTGVMIPLEHQKALAEKLARRAQVNQQAQEKPAATPKPAPTPPAQAQASVVTKPPSGPPPEKREAKGVLKLTPTPKFTPPPPRKSSPAANASPAPASAPPETPAETRATKEARNVRKDLTPTPKFTPPPPRKSSPAAKASPASASALPETPTPVDQAKVKQASGSAASQPSQPLVLIPLEQIKKLDIQQTKDAIQSFQLQEQQIIQSSADLTKLKTLTPDEQNKIKRKSEDLRALQKALKDLDNHLNTFPEIVKKKKYENDIRVNKKLINEANEWVKLGELTSFNAKTYNEPLQDEIRAIRKQAKDEGIILEEET